MKVSLQICTERQRLLFHLKRSHFHTRSQMTSVLAVSKKYVYTLYFWQKVVLIIVFRCAVVLKSKSDMVWLRKPVQPHMATASRWAQNNEKWCNRNKWLRLISSDITFGKYTWELKDYFSLWQQIFFIVFEVKGASRVHR